MNGFSIIVCCYNSAKRIDETLHYLSELIIPDGTKCEVLVINNNSDDNTAELAIRKKRIFDERSITFRVIEEPRPGLSVARKTGVDASVYDTIIFCDDDNHLDAHYIIMARQIFNDDPSVGIVGGWSKPKLPATAGAWVKDFFPVLAIGRQAQQDGYLDWVFGAGMVVKKEIFEELKKKKINLLLSDRMGSKQTSGGDSEICAVARFLGYKVYYSEKLILHHQISEHRLTARSFIRANYRTLFSLIYLNLLQILINNQRESAERMYAKLLKQHIYLVFYFLPRMCLGRHQFYSFIMVYQSLQLSFWLLTRKDRFKRVVFEIKKNLYSSEIND